MAALRNDSNITKIELFMLFPSYSGTLWCCSNKFRIDEIYTYSIRLEKELSSQRKSMEFSVCSGEWNNSGRKRRGQSSPGCLSDTLESFWASSWSRWDFRTEKFWSWAWKIWKMDAPNMYPRRMNAKEVLIRQDDEFIFPMADGTAKLSGRDYEFREPL